MTDVRSLAEILADKDGLLTIAIDQARAFIAPMLTSEDEGVRLCAGSVQRAIDGLLKKAATVAGRTRDEALEEAAHECDEEAKWSSEDFRDGCETCAAAIRALKEGS